MEIELDSRQKLLLLFLSGGREIDPIRIMKGIFLFTMGAPEEWLPPNEKYQFVPYNYGPCSTQIYSDLKLLKEKGLIQSRQVEGKSWSFYTPTPLGNQIVTELKSSFQPEALIYLQELYSFVLKSSLRHLLGVVYKKYPAYAVNSVFQF